MGVFFPSCYLRMVVYKRLKEPYGRSSAAMSIHTPPQPPYRGPTSGEKLVWERRITRTIPSFYGPFCDRTCSHCYHCIERLLPFRPFSSPNSNNACLGFAGCSIQRPCRLYSSMWTFLKRMRSVPSLHFRAFVCIL